MRQQKPAGTKQRIETVLERLEKLGLGEDVKDMDDMQGIADHTDALMLVASASVVWPCTDNFLVPLRESSVNFRRCWSALEPQIMWEMRRMSGLCLIS